MQLEVAERDRRDAARQLLPRPSAVHREVETRFRREKEQFTFDVVLLERPRQRALRQVARHRAPRAPEVRADEDVRREVAGLVRVGDRVDRPRVEGRRLHVVDEGLWRQARQHGRARPAAAAVRTHLHEPIVGPDHEHAGLDGGFCDGRDGGVLGHRARVVQRVHAPDAPQEALLVAVQPLREVAADGRPRAAAVVAAPQALRCVVEAPGVVRADEQGRIPVPALRRIAVGGLRPDPDRLLAASIPAVQVPFLPHQVEHVRIARVERHAVPVRAQRRVPVVVPDAFAVERARGAVQRAQVLRPCQDVVERRPVAQRHLVELRHRQVRKVPPRRPLVEALVEAPVGARQQVSAVARVDPECVVVAVLVAPGLEGGKRRAAVPRDLKEHIHLVHEPGSGRGGLDLLVVVRARAP